MPKSYPKVELSLEILDIMAKYYRMDPEDPGWNPEEYVDWECFSHPSLELHDCNIRSRLPGGHRCLHCDHIVGRQCPLSCEFQIFCLGVYAWRIGIGGRDLKKAIEHNLYKLRPEELYEEVIKKFSVGDPSSVEPEEPESLLDLEVPIDEDFEKPEEEEPKKSKVRESKEDMLSISEAATLYGCTYANIYNYVKDGRIPSISKNRRMFVKREDLMEFRDRPRRLVKK